MFCENCNSYITLKYGSGRFCSKKCARSFSTKNKRKTINKKISDRLKGRKKTAEEIQSLKDAWIKRKPSKKRLDNSEFFVLNSKNNNQKIKARLFETKIKDYVCEECDIKDYNNKPITLQLHHINGNKKDNRLENLQILCPNCHSQTANYAGKKF